MRTSREKFQERRKRVYELIEREGRILFSELVNRTGFSGSEILFHLVALNKRRESPVYILWKHKIVLSFYEREREKTDWQRSFNKFMYGCGSPLHVHGVGYVDPNSRFGKRFVDP